VTPQQEPASIAEPVFRQIAAARSVPQLLNFDAERANERSALVLLALLHLTPAMRWSEATNSTIRTVEIINWIATHYQRRYKPNTRERIRRQTLHQFTAAALVEENPDDPDRPTNSPN
jgi:hypothetical protein